MDSDTGESEVLGERNQTAEALSQQSRRTPQRGRYPRRGPRNQFEPHFRPPQGQYQPAAQNRGHYRGGRGTRLSNPPNIRPHVPHQPPFYASGPIYQHGPEFNHFESRGTNMRRDGQYASSASSGRQNYTPPSSAHPYSYEPKSGQLDEPSECISCQPSQLGYMQNSDDFLSIRRDCHVKFNFDFDSKCIRITGAHEDKQKAKQEILTKLGDVCILNKKKTQLVLQLFRIPNFRKACMKRFRSLGLVCGMDIKEDRVSLCSGSDENVNKCHQILQDEICESTFPEGKDLSPVQQKKLEQEIWKRFKFNNQRQLNAVFAEDDKKTKIAYACFDNGRADVILALEGFLCDDSKKQLFEGDSERVQYINTHGEDWLKQIVDEERKYRVSFANYEKVDQLLISGTDEGIKRAIVKLKERHDSVMQEIMTVPIQAITKFAATNEFKPQLEKIEEKTLTLIIPQQSAPGDRIGMVGSDTLSKAVLRVAGSLNLALELGDITKTKADVIVNTVGRSLDLSAGTVSPVLLAAAGPELQVTCKTLKPNGLQSGEMVRTPGFRLTCSNVFHVCCADWNNGQGNAQQVLHDLITNCLDEAKKLGRKTIAFPAIGTGNLGYPLEVVVKTMFNAVLAHDGTTSTLEEIKFVIYEKDQKTYEMFQKEMQTRKKTSIGSSYGAPSVSPSQPVLVLYGRSTESLMKAKNKLQKIIDGKFFCKEFGSENEIRSIKLLTTKQKNDMLDFARKCEVDILLDGIGLRVIGPKQFVYEVSDRVRDELSKCDRAKMLTIEWQFFKDNCWKPIGDAITNLELEESFQHNSTTNICITQDGISLQADLTRKILIDMTNKSTTYNVQRFDKSKQKDLPAHWQLTEGYREFVLAIGSLEYQTVQQDFMASVGAGWRVLQITRIQNPHLYEQYQAQKKKVTLTLTPGVIIERTLWHGTREENMPKICKDGFNRSYSGVNAVAFGQGSYFAVNASYSADNTYSVPNAQGHKFMMQCKVITGEFCLGNSSMKTAPYKTSDQLYNSTANNATNPSIFVVYHDTAAYPDYVIKFSM